MQEYQFIETFSHVFGNSPYQADAEILPDLTGFELFSMDSFSEREDFFAQLSPWQIGHNMAYAACSDLLACGAIPEYLLQNWNCDSNHGLDFYKKVSEGIQEVLNHYGTKCIGGDLGTASEWIWTATVISHASRPITRVASQRIEFDLYTSGLLGEANAAIFCGQGLPTFALRQPVSSDAIFATDTSGGLFDALENFRRVNQGLLLELDVDALISPAVQKMLPSDARPGWALVGGVGEYELLFALPTGTPCREGIKIGGGHFDNASGENHIRLLCDGKCGLMKEPPPDYRDIPEENWLSATAQYWTALFN